MVSSLWTTGTYEEERGTMLSMLCVFFANSPIKFSDSSKEEEKEEESGELRVPNQYLPSLFPSPSCDACYFPAISVHGEHRCLCDTKGSLREQKFGSKVWRKGGNIGSDLWLRKEWTLESRKKSLSSESGVRGLKLGSVF